MKSWSVTVEVEGECIITLGSDGSMCGLENMTEEQELYVEEAAQSLLDFITHYPTDVDLPF